MAASSRWPLAAPVAVDAELAHERLDTLEGGHRVVPQGPAPVHGQHGGQVVLAPGMHHPAVAAARPPADVVAVDHDDPTPMPGQLPPGRQTRVAGADDHGTSASSADAVADDAGASTPSHQ